MDEVTVNIIYHSSYDALPQEDMVVLLEDLRQLDDLARLKKVLETSAFRRGEMSPAKNYFLSANAAVLEEHAGYIDRLEMWTNRYNLVITQLHCSINEVEITLGQEEYTRFQRMGINDPLRPEITIIFGPGSAMGTIVEMAAKTEDGVDHTEVISGLKLALNQIFRRFPWSATTKLSHAFLVDLLVFFNKPDLTNDRIKGILTCKDDVESIWSSLEYLTENAMEVILPKNIRKICSEHLQREIDLMTKDVDKQFKYFYEIIASSLRQEIDVKLNRDRIPNLQEMRERFQTRLKVITAIPLSSNNLQFLLDERVCQVFPIDVRLSISGHYKILLENPTLEDAAFLELLSQSLEEFRRGIVTFSRSGLDLIHLLTFLPPSQCQSRLDIMLEMIPLIDVLGNTSADVLLKLLEHRERIEFDLDEDKLTGVFGTDPNMWKVLLQPCMLRGGLEISSNLLQEIVKYIRAGEDAAILANVLKERLGPDQLKPILEGWTGLLPSLLYNATSPEMVAELARGLLGEERAVDPFRFLLQWLEENPNPMDIVRFIHHLLNLGWEIRLGRKDRSRLRLFLGGRGVVVPSEEVESHREVMIAI